MDEYLRLTPSPGGAVSERMQALLSRAVEEQVNEQREVQSLLSEVRNALADVQRDSHVAPGGQADLRAELANHAGETRSQLALLDERLEAIVRAVGTSAQVLQGISGQLERVAEMVREQAAGAGRVEPVTQVRREVADLRDRVDSVEATMRADVAALQDRLATDVERLHGATEESSRTIANHVDNAVLVLAEALLRRPGAGPTGAGEPAPVAAMAAEPEPAAEAAVAAEPEPAEPDAAQESEPAPEPAPEAESAAEAAEPVDETEPAAAQQDWFKPASETGAASDAVSDDDPLWGASFRERPAPAASDDDAGGLVDAGRSGSGPDWPTAPSGGRTSYDDPLADLPMAAGARPGLGVPAAAPYDLERALFGDRSRQAPATDQAAEGAPEHRGGAEAGHQREARPVTGAAAGHEHDEHEDDDEADAPRRRPWWRPSS